MTRDRFTVLAITAGMLMAVWTWPAQAASGRTDRLKGAPFYKNYAKEERLRGGSAVALPVVLDEAMRTEFFYQGKEATLQPLLDAMNRYLAELDWVPLIDGAALPERGAPVLFVGSAEAESAPAAAAAMRVDTDKYPPMVVHFENPSSDWRSALRVLADTTGAERILVFRLGLTEYPKADRGLFGKKVVLGTGYDESIKFLSAEDVPVEVLQITGIVLDREGKPLRAGAEGILYKDTPFSLQIFEARQGISDEALSRLMAEETRAELSGAPLKWQAALHNLAAQLLAMEGRVLR